MEVNSTKPSPSVRVPFCYTLTLRRAQKLTGGNQSFLSQVFNFKLGCFLLGVYCIAFTNMPTSRVENSAQV
jgi:hypothetical protein